MIHANKLKRPRDKL